MVVTSRPGGTPLKASDEILERIFGCKGTVIPPQLVWYSVITYTRTYSPVGFCVRAYVIFSCTARDF